FGGAQHANGGRGACARMLEGGVDYPTAEQLRELQVVTVLAGGVRSGVEPGFADLTEHTYLRTVAGVRAFRQSGAARLVMQGQVGRGAPDFMVAKMRDLAVALGVDESMVLLEA